MEDRVGDLLAQRAKLERGPLPGIVISLALHGAIAGAVILAAFHQPPPETTSIVSIKFAPMASAAPAVTRPAKPKPAAPPPPQPHLEVPETPAAKPPLVQAPRKNAVPLSPFGKSTKKGAEMAPPPAPVPQLAPGTKSAADVPVGGAGVTGIEGDFPYTIYIDRMRVLVGGHWYRPQVPAGTTATVRFVIDRDGTIRDATIETSSGSGLFDRSALTAIRDTQTLPPLPFGYAGTYLGVHLTFK